MDDFLMVHDATFSNIKFARLFQEVHIGSVETPVGTGSVSGEQYLVVCFVSMGTIHSSVLPFGHTTT